MSHSRRSVDHLEFPPQRRFSRRSFFFFGTRATDSAARPIVATGAESPHATGKPAHPAASGMPDTLGSKDNALSRFPVFDAHLHCPSDEIGDRIELDRPKGIWQLYPVTKTFAEFVAYLDRTGVYRGIISSVRCQEAKSPADFIAGNREVARYVDKFRSRFLGACVVNPVFIDEALREIEYCKNELGFKWVGELCNFTVPYEYTIQEFSLLVEHVTKLKMVLAVHAELRDMHYILQNFPQATIVFPHFGDSQTFARIELVAAHPNAYIDTSGYGHDRVGILEYAVKTVGADRVLFGSDFSINCPTTVLGRIQNAFLTDEQKQKILGRNLEGLLAKMST
jgi:uncharacterized protein